MINLSSENVGSLSKGNSNRGQLQFYKPSQKISSWICKDSFQLRFENIKNTMVDRGFCAAFCAMIKWRMNYVNEGIPTDLDKLNQELPVQTPTFPVHKTKITYTWIGHSTAVISFGEDANFIIDPVFSERASPVQCIGPKRFRPLPCQIHHLPRIDAVLVSHDHYDHMDSDALEKIYKRFPNCQFFAGLNSQDVFPSKCRMNTMDWTEQREVNINNKIFKLTFVPVCHWSRRGLFDHNHRLWGGFVIESPTGKKVFYSGDTGYCEIFKELTKVFGSFDLCILPIGAYLPRQFLVGQHIDPQQAVKIHLQMKSKKSVGVHWGTFPLGYQHYCAARKDLHKALDDRNMDRNSFVTINHGGHFQCDYI